MSATPRTDAFKRTVGKPWWEFAGELETELNEALVKLRAAEADADRLAEALRFASAWVPEGTSEDESLNEAIAAHETRIKMLC